MASSGKKKTTMAKLNRERKLLERRRDKQARKEARKNAAGQHPEETGDGAAVITDESLEPSDDHAAAHEVAPESSEA
jgi:hypothetical protein